MSDKNKVLKEQLGTPLVWIKNAKGEVVLDANGKYLSSRLTKFKYSYDEENDDECNIKFSFPDSSYCDNIIFNADTVLKVQWGYVTPRNQLIKSPERSIAIRDIKTDYTDSGVELTLECTDLISYIKNVKTNSIKKSSYFVDWLKEVSEGKFKATITLDGFKTIIDKQGTVKDFNFDKKANKVTQVAVDNARFETREVKLNFTRILKGKSLALNNAIDDMLMDMDSQDGPLLQDSTDDVLEIRPRNFEQDIFKSFTYKGTTGELLSFKVRSDTKKIKEDQNFSTNINPKTKTIKEQQVEAADTQISKGFTAQNGFISKEPKQDEIDNWLETVRDIYDYNIKNPTRQKDVPDMTYKRTVLRTESYMGQIVAVEKPFVYTLPAKEILSNPEYLDEVSNNRLTNYTLEKLQKKYQAKATTIGDPSLIKARIYYISNVSKKDTGRWYSVKVEHIIDSGSGYRCEMDMVKKPSSIYLNNNSDSKKVEDNNDELKVSNQIENKETKFYGADGEKEKTTTDNIDNKNDKGIIKDNTNDRVDLKGMLDRIEILNAEDDILNNSDSINPDNFEINNIGLDNSDIINIQNLKKYNADGF